jgi:hypothetical protein
VVFEDGGVELRGGRARIDFARAFDRADVRVGGGVAHTWLEPQIPASAGISTRSIAFGELTGTARQTGDGSGLTESLWMHVSGGRDNEGRDFGRGVVSLGMRAAMTQALPLDMSVTYGRVSADASTFERFVIGGLPSMLVDPSVLAQRMPMAALPSRVGIGDHVLAFRAATSLFGVAPFYWGASVRDGPGRFERWHRAAGVELTIDQTPLPVLGTPGARLTAGIARSLDAPLARATRAYLTLVLRP